MCTLCIVFGPQTLFSHEMLGLEFRTLCMLGKCSTIFPASFQLIFFFIMKRFRTTSPGFSKHSHALICHPQVPKKPLAQVSHSTCGSSKRFSWPYAKSPSQRLGFASLPLPCPLPGFWFLCNSAFFGCVPSRFPWFSWSSWSPRLSSLPHLPPLMAQSVLLATLSLNPSRCCWPFSPSSLQ